MRELTPEQQAAVVHPARRLSIVASAGSGKTEVLARRVVLRLLEGADPASIIAFTFTEKAAEELKARIEARAAEASPAFAELPPVARGLFVGTTHGWAFQMLQQLGGEYGAVDALTEEQEWALLFRLARRLGIVDLYAALQGKGAPAAAGVGARVATAPAVHVFLRSAEVVHNERVDRETLRREAPEFAAVLERYEALLQEMRLVPFRLMLSRAVDELGPGGHLRARLQGVVRHVFVDEFQDFNRTQDELLARLVSLGADVTVVGDDDQAVYQWRGGDVRVFTSFARRHGAETVQLARNHRSRPEIVEFAAHLVRGLDGRIEKELQAARERVAGGCVEFIHADTPEEEALVISRRIERLLEEGIEPGHIAVLYRSVRTSARPLVEALRARRIPVSVVGKTSLLAHPEMALIARILVWWAGGRWYPNPDFTPEVVTDQVVRAELARVLGGDEPSLEPIVRRLAEMGRSVREHGVDDSVALLHEMLTVLGLPRRDPVEELGLGRLSELLSEFDHAMRRAAPRHLYEAPAAGAAPGAADEALEDAAMRPAEQDGSAVAAGTGAPGPSTHVLGVTRGEVYLARLRAFLEEFAGRAAEETPDRLPGSANAVQVMTVHQAKGLGFPVVFVPSLVERRFPSALMGRPQVWLVPPALFDRERYEGREEDEARLLYVALTRAKELLVLSMFRRYPGGEGGNGAQGLPAKPSRFLTGPLKPALALAVPGGSAPPPRGAPGVRVATEPVMLDFSQIITYAECGRQYWLRYVCGFQPRLAPEIGFGRMLHHLVAELARQAMQGRVPSERDVKRLVAQHFYLPLAGPVPSARLREAARRRLSAYVRRHAPELARTLKVEAGFEVPLAAARIRGRVDLLLRADGAGRIDSQEAADGPAGAPGHGQRVSVELIDFKTSANRPPSEIHVNQLRLYAEALARLGYEPVRMAIHDLDDEHGARSEVPHDERARSAFRDRLEEWVDGLRSGRYPPASDVATCRACDFRTFCPDSRARR